MRSLYPLTCVSPACALGLSLWRAVWSCWGACSGRLPRRSRALRLEPPPRVPHAARPLRAVLAGPRLSLPSPLPISLLPSPLPPSLPLPFSPGLSVSCLLPRPCSLSLLHHGLPLPHACYGTVDFSLCRYQRHSVRCSDDWEPHSSLGLVLISPSHVTPCVTARPCGLPTSGWALLTAAKCTSVVGCGVPARAPVRRPEATRRVLEQVSVGGPCGPA